ncbi:MAG: BatD family protein [Dysgonamonadaceae bacterium]|jgi:hypothetical protein|nr:BatD family protein [Dysgonamonadaceae bacterium]
MKNRQILFLFLLCFGFAISVQAQQPVIKAAIDSTHILIGEQTLLHLEIAANNNNRLQLPVIPDTLVTGVEVLNISQPDTTDIGNGRMQIKYDYLITSFDSALYQIPAFPLIAGIDTFYSNDLALKVSTLPVDTESKNIYDIKDVITPKFVLADYLQILFYILAVCLVILLIVYIIFRKKKQKPILPFKKEEIILPPHVWAIQALDNIKEQKLWQAGKEKEYHSQITDVMRKYMEMRFNIFAMEMTSGQILNIALGISEIDYVFDKLKQMLLLSDLVKFAKYRPLPDENEMSMMNAYLFINGTKKEIPEKNEVNENIEANEINEDNEK